MRMILILWLGPVSFLGSWYYLSLNDINFGTLMFSRALHDHVFEMYSAVLGVPAEVIPAMVAKAIFFDSFIVLGIIAWRKRKWISARIAAFRAAQPVVSMSEESLSKAP